MVPWKLSLAQKEETYVSRVVALLIIRNETDRQTCRHQTVALHLPLYGHPTTFDQLFTGKEYPQAKIKTHSTLFVQASSVIECRIVKISEQHI